MATPAPQDIGTPVFFTEFFKALSVILDQGASVGRICFNAGGQLPMEVEVRITKIDGKKVPRITQSTKGA